MTTAAAVAGDGIVTIPVAVSGGKNMVFDISEGFGTLLHNQAAASVQAAGAATLHQAQLANAALQAQIVEDAREVGLLEGRTASGVLATPLASPVTRTP